MKKEFQNKDKGLGSLRHWKVMTMTLLLLTFSIGKMWGTDYLLINGNDNSSTATLNTADFWTQGTFSAKSNGGDLKKCIVLGGNISAGVTNVNYPSRYISYGVKTTAVTLTITLYQSNNSEKKINIYEVNEAANGSLTVTNTSEKSVSKGLQTVTFTASPAAGTRSTIYITSQAASNFEFYQVTASETGSNLTNLKGGRAGYAIDYSKKSRLATKSGEDAMLDSVLYYHLSADYKPNNGTSVSLKTGNYIKFKTIEPVLLTVVTTSAYKFYVAQTADGTTNEKAAAATHQIKLTAASDWYIVGGASSATLISSITFSAAPKVTYNANGGGGSMDQSYFTVSANGFTPPTGQEFLGWKDGSANDYAVGDEVESDVTLYAQWGAAVDKYTVVYKDEDGTTDLGSEEVEVGSHPSATGITATKEWYTFASWQLSSSDIALDAASWASVAKDETITLTARYSGPNYASTLDFAAITTAGTTESNPIEDFLASGNMLASNLYGTSAWETSTSKSGFLGYKLRNKSAVVKFLVQAGKKVVITFGNVGADVTLSKGGVNTTIPTAAGDDAETVVPAFIPAADMVVTITTSSGSSSTVTLKKIEILDTYTATRVDGKSDGAGSDPNVTETTLPTPTAISGWTFTGWVANADVKAGETTKTAGTVLAAGTYTLLANTTFTAQWAEASSTYDITYVSAHGTAPDAANAASVVLAELAAEGWAHKGWTANADVTVDAATVEAGTLIANGKTVILASDVTFTAVWKEIFTVTFDAKGGSAVDPIDVEDGATLAAAPSAPTKDDYIFQGWSETDGGDVVADITAITISDDKTFYAIWALDVQVSEIVFSNSFKGWIHDGQVEVFYMAGESAPTITSYAGKNLKAEGGVVVSGDKVIATGTDDSELEFDLTITAVTPLAATGAQTFDGSETYIKTRHAWTADRKWKMSKHATDGRVAKGETSMYIFLGAAESVTLDWGAQKVTEDVAVYVNGTFVKNIGKNNNSAIALTNGNNMVALYSLQTSGDIWLNGLTVAPWVPVTAVALKEGEDPISSKEIWASTNFTLTAEVTPDNASNKTITWTSSNDAIATVVNGVVTGVAANADPVTITASTVDGVTATCAVTVTAAPSPCETPNITGDLPDFVVAYCAGSEPTLNITAEVSDGGTLHYAWYKVGDPDAAVGTDAASYTVESAGTYYVIVTNQKAGSLDASVTSNEASVTMNVAAAITTQPTNKRDIVSGDDVTLSVVATNATSYQWYSCDDAEKHNAAAITGEDESDYTFACTSNGYYYCVVGNACGDDLISNVVSVKLEPTGCNLIGTATDNSYTKTGEWSVYPVNSNGVHTPTDNNFGTCKAFDNTTDVNCINTRRFAINFVKDVESVTIYARGGTGRTFTSVSVSSEMTKNTYTELTDIDKQITTIDGAGNQYVITTEGIIPGGQYAWFEFSGSFSGVFKICYTEAPAKCEAPVLPALANKELCEGDAFTAWDATATVSDGGSLSYQWYNGDTDEALSGKNAAEFTPTEDGNYYVIVTNKKTGYRDNTTKSATLSVEHFAGTAITTAPANVRKSVGEDATLEVVATGKNLSYVWYTCDDAEGNNPVAIDPAETNATLNVMVPDGIQWYKVVVSSDCGADLSAVAKVEKFVALPQLHITGTTNWDLTTCADAEIKLTSTTSPKKGEECLMANIEGVHLDANFNSQALVMSGEYIYRTSVTGNPTCAEYMKFITDVEGVVTVTFAGNGSNRLIRVTGANGVQYSTVSTGTGDTHTEKFYVTPGEVELMGMNSAKTSDKQYMRFFNIAFKAEPDYTRNVTEGRYGTICLPNGGVMVGASLYEVAYYGQTSEKIFFDEIVNGVMEAGVPYIFLPREGATQLGVYYTDAVNATAGNHNGLYGSYSRTELPSDGSCYILLNNQYCQVLSAENYVGANKAYIKLDDITPVEPALVPGRRRMSMSVVRQTPTGLENGELLNGENGVQKVLINGELFILRGEKMYDATGRLVK